MDGEKRDGMGRDGFFDRKQPSPTFVSSSGLAARPLAVAGTTVRGGVPVYRFLLCIRLDWSWYSSSWIASNRINPILNNISLHCMQSSSVQQIEETTTTTDATDSAQICFDYLSKKKKKKEEEEEAKAGAATN